MKLNFIELPAKNTPRWIIFSIDVLICLCSIALAYLLRFNFEIPQMELRSLQYVIPFVLGVRIAGFIFFRTYAGIIRYTSTRDAQRIFLTTLSGSSLFLVSNLISFSSTEINLIPYSIVIIDFLCTVFTMSAMRVFVKTLYLELRFPSREKKKVIIYGAGEL